MTVNLYRLYDADDELLYVGISANLHRRLRRHHETKPWFAQVDAITVSDYDTRGAAQAAERNTVCSEKPRYNIQLRQFDLKPLFHEALKRIVDNGLFWTSCETCDIFTSPDACQPRGTTSFTAHYSCRTCGQHWALHDVPAGAIEWPNPPTPLPRDQRLYQRVSPVRFTLVHVTV